MKVPENGLVPPEGMKEVIPADIRSRVDRVLIPEGFIRQRVAALASHICVDYADADELSFVVVLKGAFVFAADLGREIHKHGGPEVRYHFLKSRTYGREVKRSGETEREVEIELAPSGIKAENVLLIEDIVDQGFTLSKIVRSMKQQGVGSIRVCALLRKALEKPSEEVRELRDGLTLHYLGFEVPDRWIAGYGIDAGEDFRNLPFIVAVRENHYLRRS